MTPLHTQIEQAKERIMDYFFERGARLSKKDDVWVTQEITSAYELGHRAAIEEVEKKVREDRLLCGACGGASSMSHTQACQFKHRILSSIKESDNGSAQEK